MSVARTFRQAKIHSKDRERQTTIDSVMELAKTEDGARYLTRVEGEAARRRAALKFDPLGFIYRYVEILDPDNGGLIPFHLWPAQAKALKTIHDSRMTIVLKARQLGLSWLALAYAAWSLLTKPGYTIVVMSRGEAESKEMVFRLKIILENLPKWITRNKIDAEDGWPGPVWDCGVLRCEVHHPDGPMSRLLGEEAAPNSGRSFTAGMVILDEWAFQEWARDIWKAAYPTINRPNGGKVIGISTADPGTLFQDLWEDAVTGKNNFTPVFLPWDSDPNRTKEWYDRTLRDIGPLAMAQEYPATPTECFHAGAKKSFPEFKYDIHTVDPFPIPEDWIRVRGYDHGFVEAACVLWGAIDNENTIWIYRELYVKQWPVREIAREVHRLETNINDLCRPKNPDYLEKIRIGWADTQIFERNGIGPTPADEFLAEKIVWEKADKDRQLGWAECHSRLALKDNGKPSVYIVRTCENLIREITRARTTKNNSDDVDKQRVDDHGLDSFRYILRSNPRGPLKQIPQVPIWQRRRKDKRERGTSWMSW